MLVDNLLRNVIEANYGHVREKESVLRRVTLTLSYHAWGSRPLSRVSILRDFPDLR